jgi:HSP20 family protein
MKQNTNHIKAEFVFDPFKFFDSFNNEVWSTPTPPVGATVHPVFVPEIDLLEVCDRYLLCADLPGFSKEEIKVEVTPEGFLTLTGTRNISHNLNEAEALLSERKAGVFERSLQLADPVDANKVSANYECGVLKITIPKLGKNSDAPKIMSLTCLD